MRPMGIAFLSAHPSPAWPSAPAPAAPLPTTVLLELVYRWRTKNQRQRKMQQSRGAQRERLWLAPPAATPARARAGAGLITSVMRWGALHLALGHGGGHQRLATLLAARLQHLAAAGGGHARAEAADASTLPATVDSGAARQGQRQPDTGLAWLPSGKAAAPYSCCSPSSCQTRSQAAPACHSAANWRPQLLRRQLRPLRLLPHAAVHPCSCGQVRMLSQQLIASAPHGPQTHLRVPPSVTPRPFLLLHSTSRPVRPRASCCAAPSTISAAAGGGAGLSGGCKASRAARW